MIIAVLYEILSAIQIHLEPYGVLYVCTGMPFEINCSVDLLSVMGSSHYDWNITLPYYNNQLRRRSFLLRNNTMPLPVVLNSTTLNFSSRAFPHRVLSTVFTDNATADLTGAVLTCSWQLVSNSSVNGSDSVQLVLVGGDTGNVNSKLLTLWKVCL